MKTLRKRTKVLNGILVISAVVCVIGIILAACGFFSGASLLIYADAKGIHTGNAAPEYIKRAELPEVKNVVIEVSNTDIQFIKAEQFALDVCYYPTDLHPKLEVADGMLRVYEERDETYGQRYFNIDLRNSAPRSYVRIYIPESARFDEVNIRLGNGTATIGDFAAKRLTVGGYGSVQLSNLKLDSGSIQCNTSEITPYGTGYYLFGSQLSLTNVSARLLEIPSGAYNSMKMDKLNTEVLNCSGRFDSGIEVRNSTWKQSDWVLQSNEIMMYGVTSGGMKLNNSGGGGVYDIQGAFSGQTQVETENGELSFATALEQKAYRWSAGVNTYVTPKAGEGWEDGDSQSTTTDKSTTVPAGEDGNNYFIKVNGLRQKGKTVSGGSDGSKNGLSVRAKNGNLNLQFG